MDEGYAISGVDRVVVFRPGALGDTLLSVGALAALRSAFPGAVIELVGNLAGQVLRRAGVVDGSSSFDSLQVAGLFLSSPVVSYRWHDARLVVLWMKRVDWLGKAFEAAGAQQVLAASPEPEDPRIHVADHLIRTLRPVGVAPPDRWPRLTVPPDQVSAHGAGDRPILHPGSGASRKNWRPDAFASLVRELRSWGMDPLLVQGPADEAALVAVQAALGKDQVEVARPRNVSALAALLNDARLFVGNDSGVSHLAALLAVPSAVVFGATDPARWAPRGERVRILGGLGAWPTLDEVVAVSAELLDSRVGG